MPPPLPLPLATPVLRSSCRALPRLSTPLTSHRPRSEPLPLLHRRRLSTTPRAPHYLTGTNTSATLPPTWFDNGAPAEGAPSQNTNAPGGIIGAERGNSKNMPTATTLEDGRVRGQQTSTAENNDGGGGGGSGGNNRPNIEEEDESRYRRRNDPDHEPPDERTLQLGKTIRTLQARMPTLLHSPLPTDILSPSITLHLFPSTHPDLPIVRGRVAYIAALWTSPVAWGRLPGSSTELEVISERMLPDERLKIRWRAGSGFRSGSTLAETHKNHTNSKNGKDKSFQGIFIFEFDEQGKVKRHVIENVEEDDSHVGGVITVTEWLIRAAKGKKLGGDDAGGKGLAWQCRRR